MMTPTPKSRGGGGSGGTIRWSTDTKNGEMRRGRSTLRGSPRSASTNRRSMYSPGRTRTRSECGEGNLAPSEIPLLYHHDHHHHHHHHHSGIGGSMEGRRRRRFALNYADASATQVQNSGNDIVMPTSRSLVPVSASAKAHTPRINNSNNGSSGAASVTPLRISDGAPAIATTTLLPENSRVLLLSVFFPSDGESSSSSCKSVELDLGPLPPSSRAFLGFSNPMDASTDPTAITGFGYPVKAACFAFSSLKWDNPYAKDDLDETYFTDDDIASSASSSVDAIRLNLVDSDGTILSIGLNLHDLTPICLLSTEPTILMKTISLPNLIHSKTTLRIHPGASTSGCTVDHLSQTRLLIGLAPHLLCVDLNRVSVVPWTPTHTVKGSRRRTTMGVLQSASSILLGQNPDAMEDHDEFSIFNPRLGSQDDSTTTETASSSATRTVAALCVASSPFDDPFQRNDDDDEDTDDGRRIVFSVHVDGTIRVWWSASIIKPSSSLYPYQARTLRFNGNATTDSPFPPPHTWSTAPESVLITSRLYTDWGGGGTDHSRGRVPCFALAIGIRCAEGATLGDAVTLTVLHGRADASKSTKSRYSFSSSSSSKIEDMDITSGSGESGFVRLVVPREADELKDLRFCPGMGRCELTVLFLAPMATDVSTNFRRGRSLGRSSAASGNSNNVMAPEIALLAIYPPHRETMVDPDPIQWSNGRTGLDARNDTMDGIAREECRVIRLFSTPLIMVTDAMDSTSDQMEQQQQMLLDSGMKEIDAEFVRRLFCPTMARSAAGGSCPSDSAILSALDRVTPTSSSTMQIGGPISHIEVRTVRAIREWSMVEESAFRSGAKATSLAMPFSSNNKVESTMTTRNDARASANDSVYRSFAVKPASEGSSLHDTEDENGGMPHGDDEETNSTPELELHRKLVDYRGRWTEFLLAVWEKEAALNTPFCLLPMARPKSHEGHEMIVDEDVDPSEIAIVLRGGVTSAIVMSSPPPSREPTTEEDFDCLALSLLEKLETNPMTSPLVASLESFVASVASGAGCILKHVEEMLESKFSDVAKGAWDHSAPHEQETFKSLQDMSELELISWISLESLFAGCISSGKSFVMSTGMLSDEPNRAANGVSEGIDEDRVVACAAHLVRHAVESIRRLALAKCILVIASAGFSQSSGGLSMLSAVHEAKRWCLHVAAVQWTLSQSIALSDRSLFSSLDRSRQLASGLGFPTTGAEADGSSPTSSPPGTRPRLSESDMKSVGGASSTFGQPVITVIEARLFDLLRTNIVSTSTSVHSKVVLDLARAFLLVVFQSDGASLPHQGKLLLELRALGPNATNQPRLALRLLAPSVAFPSNAVGIETMKIMQELTAEFLLVEASFMSKSRLMPLEGVMELRNTASSLLSMDSRNDDVDRDDFVSKEKVNDVLDVLMSAPQGGANNKTYPSAEESLVNVLQTLVFPMSDSPQEASEGIARLSKMQTVRSLFLPWMTFSNDPIEAMCAALSKSILDGIGVIRYIAQTLFRVSVLIRRVSILEKHCPTTVRGSLAGGTSAEAFEAESATKCANLVTSAISDAILALKSAFPRHICENYMSEFPSLWSSQFQHNLAGQRWTEALESCVSIPVPNRRMENFRRLVLGMVDSGALGDLLRMPLTIAGNNSNENPTGRGDANAMDMTDDSWPITRRVNQTETFEVDLYEIAAKTLAEAAQQQSGRGRAMYNHSTAGSATTDYRGCLYALHASRCDWKRAAQAMEHFGIVTVGALEVDSEQEDDLTQSNTFSSVAKFRTQAVEDITLSFLACSLATQLIPNPAERYIVSGELRQGSIPPAFQGGSFAMRDNFSLLTQTRRKNSKREREGEAANRSRDDQVNESFPDRMHRFIKEDDMSRRAVKMVALRTLFMDPLYSGSVQDLVHLPDDKIVESLSRLGYYRQVSKLATNMEQHMLPGGREMFGSVLSYMLCNFLAPVSVKVTRPTPSNINTNENGWERSELEHAARPTMSQLKHASDKLLQSYCQDSWRIPQFFDERGSVAAALLRKYVTEHASRDNSLAIDLAETLLDLDSTRASLPHWLMGLLTGARGILPSSSEGTTLHSGNGLFGCIRKNENGSKSLVSTAANPTALIHAFMKRGLYVEACDIVSSILLPGDESDQSQLPANRIPEKGNVDFVPYNVIDTLWELIEAILSTKSDERNTRALRFAREKMERAMEIHFQQLGVSQMGLKSARVLEKNS